MTDQITLRRRVTGEYCERIYTLTGAPFGELLAAVKALPYQSWNQDHKSWYVKKDGLAILRERFTVEEQSLFRVESYAQQLPSDILAAKTAVNVWPQVRDDAQYGGWFELKHVSVEVDIASAHGDDREIERLCRAAHAAKAAQLVERFAAALGNKRDEDAVMTAVEAVFKEI